ncbi:PIN domain-containing protein [Klenkia sp. LSe6-5]|uniref:Ribonuclease VapC n=1 Tax=Klenkia sesuvii TaxID=3103137 RepID=A0ABU8DUI8_9ACTN
MIAVDASVLIGQLAGSDAHHERASELLDEVRVRTLLAHQVTAAEVLVGGVRIGRGAEMSADLQRLGVEVVPTDDGAPLRLAELRVRTGLKLPDCCVLDVALQRRAALATFDDRLARVARGMGLDVVGAEPTGGA